MSLTTLHSARIVFLVVALLFAVAVVAIVTVHSPAKGIIPAMAASPTKFASAAVSDQGNVRGNNEDRVYANDARGTYAVVDGMGGHEAGEHAAEIAVEHIRARLERQAGTAEQRLREAIALANNAIYEAAEEHPEWSGMACVLTAAVVEDGHATVGTRGRLAALSHPPWRY